MRNTFPILSSLTFSLQNLQDENPYGPHIAELGSYQQPRLQWNKKTDDILYKDHKTEV